MITHQDYKIVNTSTEDINIVNLLFDEAVNYQKRNGYPLWRKSDKQVLSEDLQKNQQYKIILDHQVACIFTVWPSDKTFWREMEKGNAIYLHRIITHPDFKGQKLFQKVLDWSIEYAVDRKLKFIRLDTWANNPIIIDYYKCFGFEERGFFTTPDDPRLAPNERLNKVILLEYIL